MTQQIQILRIKTVEIRTGIPRSSIYEKIKAGTFPSPVPLGSRSVGWVSTEIDHFLNTCIAERDTSKIAQGTPLCK